MSGVFAPGSAGSRSHKPVEIWPLQRENKPACPGRVPADCMLCPGLVRRWAGGQGGLQTRALVPPATIPFSVYMFQLTQTLHKRLLLSPTATLWSWLLMLTEVQ